MELQARDEYIVHILSALGTVQQERDEARDCARHLAGKLATWREVEEGPTGLRPSMCETCDRDFSSASDGVERCEECDVADAVCTDCCPFKLTHGVSGSSETETSPLKRQRLWH